MNNIFLSKVPVARKKPQKQDGFKWLPIDKGLATIAAVLIIGGLIFTYSSSAFDNTAYFKRQLMFDAMGIVLMFTFAQFYHKLQKLILPRYILFAIWGLLIWALLLPPVKNVNRWIDFGVFNLQPSELAKLAVILYLSSFLSKKDVSRDSTLLIEPVLFSVITVLLIYLGKDLGIPALVCMITFLMLFIAGAPVAKMFYLVAVAIPLGIIAIYHQPYRLQRVTSFLDPEKVYQTTGYQLSNAFYAIGSGGWFGKGLGSSDLKLAYLPDAHTDFIFAIICEEVGMIGAFFIIAVFIWLLVRGITLARSAKDPFNTYLAAGITLCITLQAFINMGVDIGILPTKGLPLPFFSYGGSSVLVTLAMMGILMNIAAVEGFDPEDTKKGRQR